VYCSCEHINKYYLSVWKKLFARWGIGEDIAEAREISLAGIRDIDGALWNRGDIGAEHHIEKSVGRMQRGAVSGLEDWRV